MSKATEIQHGILDKAQVCLCSHQPRQSYMACQLCYGTGVFIGELPGFEIQHERLILVDKVAKAENPIAKARLTEAEATASKLFEENISDQLYGNHDKEPVRLDEARKSRESEGGAAKEKLDSMATIAREGMEDKLEREGDVKEEINEKKAEPKHVREEVENVGDNIVRGH